MLCPQWREEQQPVCCIFTPWKFHVSLIDLVSQLASQLQLTLSTIYNWQRLPPPPYAAFACVHLAGRASYHAWDERACVDAAYSFHACMWAFLMLLVVVHTSTELIPPQRRLSQSERQKAGVSRGRERQGARWGERGRGMNEFDSRQQMPN